MLFFPGKQYTAISQLVDALESKTVSAILIDAYTAGENKDVLSNPLLLPVKLIEYPRWFGAVVTGALANVESELNDYVSTNQGKILQVLEKFTEKMEV